MSHVHPAWEMLGIEPTEDVRAIRVAYSAKLKAIDVDKDAAGFIALRDAFEQAKSMAPWVNHVWDDEEDEDEEADDYDAGEIDADALQSHSDFMATRHPGIGYPVDPSGGETAVPPSPAAGPAIEWTSGGDIEQAPPPEAPPPPPPSPWAAPTPEQIEQHTRALSALLFGHGGDPGRWSTAAEDEAMIAHWRAMIADPRMHNVSYFADAERWFSDLLSQTAPFSDALVIPVTEYFGWTRTDGTIAQTRAIAEVSDRYRMLAFMQACRTPGDQHEEAWQELVTPAAEGSRRGKVSVAKVHRLIERVRREFPDLEGCFDSYRVAMWKPQTAGETGVHAERAPVSGEPEPVRSWFFRLGYPIGILLVILVVRGLMGISSPTSLPPPGSNMPLVTAPSLALIDEDRDIGSLLATIGDGTLKWDEVQERNPGLANVLRANWKNAQDERQTLPEFIKRMGELVHDRYIDGIRRAPYALITEHRRLRMDTARVLRGLDPAFCDDYFHGRGLPPELTDQLFEERYRALYSRIVLESKGDPPDRRSKSFSIAASVAEKAARRAGLSNAAFDAAFADKGTPATRCAARIGLMEVALELPAKEGLKLLREM